jgi:opacity protein-like surface antigen
MMPLLQRRKHKSLCLILFLFFKAANAASFEHWDVKNIEISGAGGGDWYQKRDASLIISPFETDSVKTLQSSFQGSWKIGLDYSFFEKTLPCLNRLLIGLNVYQTSTTLSGAVWQYELPQFNNYHFKAPIKSTRLMLDLRPGFFAWRSTESYVILGAGVAWNSTSYVETVAASGVNANSAIVLSSHTTSSLAWNFGAGFKVALTDKLSASLEYIYAILGHGSPAYDSGTVRLGTTPNFTLQSQSLLLGLSLRL